ncbi:hypothetical protein MZI84_00485, partial [Escherichia coli]|nr:hypothetical protein [Escherichia coli]
RSHWSTSKTPSYTKSVSWQHHRYCRVAFSDFSLVISCSEIPDEGGFYIFTLLMYKKTGQPGPEKLRLNTRRLSFMFHIITSQLTGRAKCYHHITFIFITA